MVTDANVNDGDMGMSNEEQFDFNAGYVEAEGRRLVVVRALTDDTIEIRAFSGVDSQPFVTEILTKDNASRLAAILRRVDPEGPEGDVWYLAGSFLRPTDVGKLVDLLDSAIAHH